MITNLNSRRASRVTDILRFTTDDSSGMNVIELANRRHPLECDIVFDDCPAANGDIRTDIAIRSNADIITKLGTWVDVGGIGDDSRHILIFFDFFAAYADSLQNLPGLYRMFPDAIFVVNFTKPASQFRVLPMPTAVSHNVGVNVKPGECKVTNDVQDLVPGTFVRKSQ